MTKTSYKYQADINQHNKIVVSYESNSLSAIVKLLQDIVDDEKGGVKAKIIDKELDKVFSYI